MTLPAARDGAWTSVSALVAGIGVAGFAAADGLVRVGARVRVVDGRDDATTRSKADDLSSRGVHVELGGEASTRVPSGIDVVVSSPGWRPESPLLTAAADAAVPIWSEIELAWRLRDPDVPWLVVTGTNGKTTTVRMLSAMLRADGRAAAAAGNVGHSLVTTVLDGEYDVLAVETSSFQLHFTHTMTAHAVAVLNVAPDHLDWHGSLDAYAADKAKAYRGAGTRVYNPDDPMIMSMIVKGKGDYSAVRLHDHGSDVGFTLREPEAGMLGVDGGALVDRAFGGERDAVVLADVADIPVAGPHNVANALAAAALARSVGVAPGSVRDGLRAFRPDPHRVAVVATIGGVTFVDDSKATNPHAAESSLSGFSPAVWIGGGLAKGAQFDDLVISVRDRLRGVVLIGADRAVIGDALARHAPDVPVVDVAVVDNMAMDAVMDRVVAAAAGLARAGDTVLLAPACASMDMFADYAVRGDAFAAAVRRHGDG